MPLQILEHVPLKKYSTFGIGGLSRFLVEVATCADIAEALQWARERYLPVFILGRASNCLFHDDGYVGLTIVNRISYIHEKPDGLFEVGGGYSFSRLGQISASKMFSGLEFAAAIPASVGGAVYMNAGACGQDVQGVLVAVETVDYNGTYRSYAKDAFSFGYRFSGFQQKDEIICSATFQLTHSPKALELQQSMIEQRRKTQPYTEKSIGCFFRNPEGHSAGRLIEQSGAKGLSCGGAEVSAVHANFIINRHHATAKDVLCLAQEVVRLVYEKFGVQLTCEAKIFDIYGKNRGFGAYES